MAMMFSILVNVSFLVMVACLLGIVWVLCKKGLSEGDQNNSVVKKRALKKCSNSIIALNDNLFATAGFGPFSDDNLNTSGERHKCLSL